MKPLRPSRVRRGMATTGALAVAVPFAALSAVAQPDTDVANAASFPTGASTGAAAAPVTATAAKAALHIRKLHTNVVLGRQAYVRGRVLPQQAGRTVTLQVQSHHGWRTVAHTKTLTHGRFQLRYRPQSIASSMMRVRTGATTTSTTARRSVGRLNVYRPVSVSWYGPGLYGSALACGGHLTPGTLGVANKTLPCGTKVTLRYHGRSVRVPVVDRGPYVAGREYDLTGATKDRLGFGDVGTVYATK